jgi:hypothetical protein
VLAHHPTDGRSNDGSCGVHWPPGRRVAFSDTHAPTEYC